MRRRQTGEIDPLSFGGRYTLIRRLAVGGMAEIYLARQAAMAGFEKDVVIKRLRTELADDPRIVEMFLDEAKIGAQLNHPNIVHVYDVDEHDGIPYIAMEYIIGEELNELCRRSIAVDRFLPLEHAVELMRQAAAGMGYFHAKKTGVGSTHAGAPLEIVHLDISPSNLLVTQDGFLKIIDFGIARAKGTGFSQAPRSDVLPGKLSYMSPEQAGRQEVDHRSDVFSLGIVLYEITVGKRLFRGPATEVVDRLIAAEVAPPTFSRHNFPPALEAIVMRALEKHPDARYQSAYDLADDLEAFLRDAKLHSGPVRIARYLDMVTYAGGGQRRAELISEAEVRGERPEDLDFDSQIFEGYAPAEGAPGPDQAAAWEDVDQPEADVAAALHMELAELRALRTPVPARPSGMAPVSGRELPLPPDTEEEEAPRTNPVTRMRTEEVYEDASGLEEASELDEGWGTPAPPALAARDFDVLTARDLDRLEPAMQLAPEPAGIPTSMYPSAAGLEATQLQDRLRAPRARQPAPQVGAAYLARTPSSKKLWMLVGALGVAVLGLIAYIVMR